MHRESISVSIDKIIDFIIENYFYEEKDRDDLYWAIKQHIKYKTFMIIHDEKNEIISLCRWNITTNGKNAHILDVVIRKDWQKKGLLREMLIKGMRMFPDVTKLIFERSEKNKRPLRSYSIDWLLKRRF